MEFTFSDGFAMILSIQSALAPWEGGTNPIIPTNKAPKSMPTNPNDIITFFISIASISD
jgi:hypothetical protein